MRYWPGRAAGSGDPSGSSSRIGDHRVALVGDLRDRQRPKARPGGRGAGCREPCVSAPRFLSQERSERRLPARTEGGDPQRPHQLLAFVPGQIQQRVHFGDRHLLRTGGELDDLVARLHLALFEHPEVEARTAVGDQQGGNLRVVHADPDPVAGHPRLGHLEGRGADPIAVPDAHLGVGEAFDGEVLAELPVREVVSSELAFPVPVGVDLVDEHRPLLAAVSRRGHPGRPRPR